MERVKRLIETGREKMVDWILCMLPENIFYFSGFRTLFYTRFIAILVPIKEKREPVLIASFIDRKIIEEKFLSPHWFKEVAIWGPTVEEAYKTHWDSLSNFSAPAFPWVDAIQYDFYEQLVQAFPGLKVVNLQNEI
jgi:Xaa-Pro aminopeptidase